MLINTILENYIFFCLLDACFLLDLIFSPEVEGNMSLRNISNVNLVFINVIITEKNNMNTLRNLFITSNLEDRCFM
jgi:hypothetical protein